MPVLPPTGMFTRELIPPLFSHIIRKQTSKHQSINGHLTYPTPTYQRGLYLNLLRRTKPPYRLSTLDLEIQNFHKYAVLNTIRRFHSDIKDILSLYL
jgi:hypothetical protein